MQNASNNVHWSRKYANYVYLVYAIFLAVLWMFVNYGGSGLDSYEGSGVRWFLITIPLFIYLASNCLILFSYPRRDNNPVITFILLYAFTALIVASIRVDVKQISEIIRWAAPVIFVVYFRTYMPLKVINALYIMAIIIVISNFGGDEFIYGFLPGQTTINLHQGLWWRVSIWKFISPPYSAAFSIIVFFANYFLNRKTNRYIFYFLSLYFLILSASRTGYFVFLICFFVIMITKFSKIKFAYNRLYTSLPIIVVIAAFLFQFYADLLSILEIKNVFLNSAILRINDGSADASNLYSRFIIILEHIRLSQESGVAGIFGIGSEIYDSPAWTSNGGWAGGTADSYVSHLIVRDGVSLVFLILSFMFLFIESMKSRNIFAYIVLLALLLYTIGYGAWLNLTSPVFVIFLGFIYQPMMIKLGARSGRFSNPKEEI